MVVSDFSDEAAYCNLNSIRMYFRFPCTYPLGIVVNHFFSLNTIIYLVLPYKCHPVLPAHFLLPGHGGWRTWQPGTSFLQQLAGSNSAELGPAQREQLHLDWSVCCAKDWKCHALIINFVSEIQKKLTLAWWSWGASVDLRHSSAPAQSPAASL